MLTRILRSRRFECRVEERDGPENMHPTVVEPLSERGFSSVSAFARAVQDWAETHHWALASMAKATILTHGAHDWTLSPPQMVMFMMDSVRPPSPSPARAFAVKNIMVVPVQDYLHKLGLGLSALQNWSRAQPVREMQERRYARTPGFLGLVPATFVADRMIATITFYPLFRPGADERRALARGGADARKARLADLAEFSSRTIDEGLPLRALDAVRAPNAVVPGEFERNARGRWVWRPLFAHWGQYRRGVHLGVDNAVRCIETKMTPREAMSLIRVL